MVAETQTSTRVGGCRILSDTDQSEAAERDLDKDVPYCTTGRRDFIIISRSYNIIQCLFFKY